MRCPFKSQQISIFCLEMICYDAFSRQKGPLDQNSPANFKLLQRRNSIYNYINENQEGRQTDNEGHNVLGDICVSVFAKHLYGTQEHIYLVSGHAHDFLCGGESLRTDTFELLTDVFTIKLQQGHSSKDGTFGARTEPPPCERHCNI